MTVVIGGATGALGTDVSASLVTNQPLSGSSTALDVLSGAISGLEGGILASRAHMGVLDKFIISVPFDRRGGGWTALD